jgi:uncharacterized protein YfeS
VTQKNADAGPIGTWCIFAHLSPASMGGGPPWLACLLMDEAGWFDTGLAQLELVFVQFGSYVPFHMGDGRIIRDGSDGSRERWEAYIAKLPTREFKRKRGRLAFQLRGDPQLDFRDRIEMGNVTRAEMRIGAEMVLRGLIYAQSTLKKSDGVDLSGVILAAEQLTSRNWASDQELRQDLAVANALDRQRIAAMDPWSKIDLGGSHPNARRILDDPSDWSEINDFAPHGNDLGADILGNWSDLRGRSVEWVARYFEIDLLSQSDSASMDRIQLLLGLAFGHVKKSGKCPDDIATRALLTLQAERNRAIEMVVPDHQAGFRAALDRYEGILKRISGTKVGR